MDKQYNSWCEWYTATQMPKEETKEVKPDAKRKTQRKQGQATKEDKNR